MRAKLRKALPTTDKSRYDMYLLKGWMLWSINGCSRASLQHCRWDEQDQAELGRVGIAGSTGLVGSDWWHCIDLLWPHWWLRWETVASLSCWGEIRVSREKKAWLLRNLMARVAGEANGTEKQWTLVFKHKGYQKRLRIKGLFAGHDTKDALKARITEELRRLQSGEDTEDVVNLQSYFTAKPPTPDSVSKTGVEFMNYNISGLSRRSSDTRGPRSLNPPRAAPLLLTGRRGQQANTEGVAAATPLLNGRRGRQANSEGVEDLRLGRVRDVVLSRELEDFRGSSRFSPTSENHNKRRKVAAAAEHQLVPVSGLLPSAAAPDGPLSVQTFAISPYMDEEESESSLDDFPEHEVDNFVVHASDKLVSVTALPVYIDGVTTGGASPPEKVFLVGTVGSNLELFRRRVKMWRLVLNPPHRPQYLLKTKRGEWVRLLNAQEDYRKVMSDVLALGHFLNFVKKLPNASPMAAEQDLRKMCSMRTPKPQLGRLSRYIKVIRSFIEEDTEFARASILRKIFPNLFPKSPSPQMDEEFELEDRRDSGGVKRKPRRLPLKSEGTERKEKRYKVMAKKNVQKPKLFKTSTPELQSENDSDYELQKRKTSRDVKRKAIDGSRLRLHLDDGSGTDYQPESDLRRRNGHRKIFTPAEVNVEDPPICIICDDGGNLLYCDGPCHRHFHPTPGSGVGSFCKTLGMTQAEVEATDNFYCPNCKHNQQQCFICGELGSSVATSDGPREVRCCDIRFCKRFFHVECAAELLCGSRDWRDFADAINNGDEKLYCPRHCCSVCGEAETEEPGMLVQCRRCPKAWHRRCLLDFRWSMERTSVRVWNQHDREFIYCRDHKILPKLQTPARDHLRFPAAE